MDDNIQQFLNYLEEKRKAPHVRNRGVDTSSWYMRGYQDAIDHMINMFKIAFSDKL